MGSGASTQSASQKSSADFDETASEQQLPPLRTALEEEEDVSEFTISEISRCKLEYPQVVPSTQSKQELRERENETEHTKALAVVRQTSSLIKLSCRDLVTALTQGLEDELSRLTAIYTHIASVDVSQLDEETDEEKDDMLANGPLEYFRKIKEYKGNHAHIFCALCKVAGIPCEIVFGYNKSSSYELGKPLQPKKLAAQWNAVYVLGEWRLVDCFWSSCCIVGSEDEDNWKVVDVNGRPMSGRDIAASHKLTHRINDFFFLTDPSLLLSTHLPKDPKWQLVPEHEQITCDQFEKAAYKRERFFEMGLGIPTAKLDTCRLNTEYGIVKIQLSIDDDSPSMSFKYMLLKSKGSETSSQLNNYVLFERNKGRVDYNLTLPITGEYKLDIFAMDQRRHNSVELACSYLIVCSSGANDPALPDNPDIGWGLHGGYLAAYGIEAVSHTDAVIETETGIVDIKYRLQGCLELQSVMLSNEHSKELLSHHSYIEATDKQCMIHVRLPGPGVYACKLFANEEALPGNLQNVCNYVIKCTNNINNTLYPHIPGGRTGATSHAPDLGSETFNPSTPESAIQDGKFKASVSVQEGVYLYGALHHPAQTLEQANKQVLVSREENTVTFDLNLDEPGLHCLAIYAAVNARCQLYHVYNYLIDNQTGSEKKVEVAEEPEIEQVIANGGKVKLQATCPSTGKVMCTLYKEGAYTAPGACKVRIKQEEEVCKVQTTIANNGVHSLQLFESNADGDGTISLTKQYQLTYQEESAKPTKSPKKKKSQPKPVKITPQPVKDGLEEKENRLRNELADAMKAEDTEKIEAAIEELNGLEKLSDASKKLLQEAESLLEILNAQKDLRMAIEDGDDEEGLEQAIENAQSLEHNGKLNKDIKEAQDVLQKIKVSKLKNSVLNLDQRTVAEIKSFATPPKPVETTMKATLMLLGTEKSELKEWRKIVALMGRTGKESLKKKVMEFTPSKLTADAANKTRTVLHKFSLADARDASSGAATFYIWADGMLETFDEIQEAAKSG